MKSHRLPQHVQPERYEIVFTPKFEDFTFSGEETIFFTLTTATKKITLHSAELVMQDVVITLGKEKIPATVSYDEKTETATCTFSKTIPAGKQLMHLQFTGILNDKMRGFYRSSYELEGSQEYMAVTQFEATDARRAFPCFDEPSLKAVFDVTLMIPSHMTAISNTIAEEVREHESGLKLVRFSTTPKMSTYLLAFVVGQFEYIEKKTKEGILVRVFVTPGKKKQAEFALDTAVN
ncbi:MAG: M1 family metallopeptidase, partial [Candidatus Levyibacteriota bacterium]